MPAFLVRPRELEHEIVARVGARRGDPGGLAARLEGLAHPKRPALLEVLEGRRQRREPREAVLVALERDGLDEIAWQGERRHAG
jgi:hypothetical protein